MAAVIGRLAALRGAGLGARAIRSSLWTVAGYSASQIARLGANLILTRILFPEAFGLMALVTVVLVGLTLFSDVGTGTAIQQSRRGDDPDFLNTAWTVQVVRGLLLWLLTCALALPLAGFYDQPPLAQMLPVAGLTLLIAGFNPTRIETAGRHLMLGRLTLLDLASQLVGLAAMILLAVVLQSVWALVLGAVLGALVKLALTTALLDGPRNRLRWEPAAGRELIRFGKWIFLATICGFLLSQGDKAILGKYLTIEALGVYNIAYFLASFPMLLGSAVMMRLMIPLYRERPPAAERANFLKLRRARLAMTGALLGLLAALAVAGVPLVGLLYDPRYAAAGAMVVLIACVQIPHVVGMTYDQAALAAGDSRNFFFVLAGRAALQIGLFLLGAEMHGLLGALAGQFAALLLGHGLIVWLARRHGAWDRLHDLTMLPLGLGLGALALWWNRAAVAVLAGFGGG